MKKIPVEKNIRDKLPEKKILPHQGGDKTKNKQHLVSGKLLLEKYHSTGNKNGFYYRRKGSAERGALVRILAHENSRKGNSCARQRVISSNVFIRLYFIYAGYCKEG